MLQKNGYPGKKDQSNTWLLSFLALVPCCWDTSFPCVYCVPGRTTFCVVPRGIACLVHGYNPLSWMVHGKRAARSMNMTTSWQETA